LFIQRNADMEEVPNGAVAAAGAEASNDTGQTGVGDEIAHKRSVRPRMWGPPVTFRNGEGSGEHGPLRDFSVVMPNLLTAKLDLQRLPYLIQVALAFLRSFSPRSCVPDKYVATLPSLLPPQHIRHRGRRTLVLDLDETLVHCHPTKLSGVSPPPLEMWIEVASPPLHAHVYVRPFAQLFLGIVADMFEVVVFTASATVYADQVLDFLDPNHRWISHRLYRQHCTELCSGHFKDMRRLGRRMEDVVLVDNSPLAAGLTPESAIVVSSWFGTDYDDTELLDLLHVLEECKVCASVPEYLDTRYGFAAYLHRQRAMVAQQSDAAGRTSEYPLTPMPAFFRGSSRLGPVTQMVSR